MRVSVEASLDIDPRVTQRHPACAPCWVTRGRRRRSDPNVSAALTQTMQDLFKMMLIRMLALAIVMLGAIPASAEDYPSRPIKIIVSTSAGGITDVAARVLGQYVTVKTGQT